MKKFLFLLLFSVFFFSFPKDSFADDKFTTTATTTYAVDQTGVTHTTMNVVINNATPTYYVTTYTLQVGFSNITNIKASDTHGPIIPVIEKNQNGEAIHLQFNNIVYGKGTSVPFTITFDTTDIATHNGNVWEINIPGLANQTDFTDFTVHVLVPPSFGNATYIKPSQSLNDLKFTKDQLGTSGISLAFGKQQTYSFTLLYHLQNSNLFPIKTEIALPPSTNYQTVALDSLSPKPTDIHTDTDGNWLAQYTLPPGKTVTVTAQGEVGVSLYPKKDPLSQRERQNYLEFQPYWQTNNKSIQNLAHELKTPENIYNYVVSHLSYDFSRVGVNQERLGAAKVLQDPKQAVCLEFTDLFITLARAAGIPSREVDGYAYTQNTRERPLSLVKDVLHAWPEYYDDTMQQWVMVDPTWGNTTGGVDYFHTLDFDHIAFVIKGASSNYPVPAGGYKLPGHEDDKDISVTFSETDLTVNPEVDAAIYMENNYLSGFPINGKITLINHGSTMFPPQKLTVAASGLTPHSQEVSVPAVLPYQRIDIPFTFDKTSFLTNVHGEVTIGFAGKTYSKQIAVTTFTINQLLIGGGIIFAILSIFIFIVTARARSVSVSRQR